MGKMRMESAQNNWFHGQCKKKIKKVGVDEADREKMRVRVLLWMILQKNLKKEDVQKDQRINQKIQSLTIKCQKNAGDQKDQKIKKRVKKRLNMRASQNQILK